jgi:hypothetical protein
MGFVDTSEDVKTNVEVDTSEGNHDRFAHYVNKDDVMEAYIEGKPVVALCGKIWVPSRDPDRYPICPSCKELYAMLFSAE